MEAMWRFALVALAGCRSLLGFEEATVADPLDGPAPDSIAVADGPPVDAPADAAPMQLSFAPIADTYLSSNTPNQNKAGDAFLIVDGSPIAVVLIEFDLAAIPVGSTVVSAELQVTTLSDPGETVTVHALNESWVESQATFNERDGNLDWSTPGANPPSRAIAACGTFTPAMVDTAFTSAIDTSVVQAWVATPANNFGIALVSINDDGPRFSSREDLIVTKRPKLTVVFTP